MRYINREYGFTFYPPFSNFYKESAKGPAVKESNYPGRYIVGAGYDYSAIEGAMLIGKYGSLWGIKVTYHNGIKWVEGNDFLTNMRTSCVSAPDETFWSFSSGPLTVKWAKHQEQGLGVEISASRRLRVRVVFYPCYGWPGELSIEGSFVKGRSPYVAVIPGEIKLTESYAVFKNRYQVVLDDKDNREFFIAQSFNTPLDSASGAFNEVMMEFIINNNQPSVYLYCAVGDEKVLAMDVPRRDKIATLIETAELRYGVRKTMGTGVLGSQVETVLNSAMWNKIYFPYLLDTVYTARRNELDNFFDIRGLEENCAAILASYAGEGNLGERQLEHTADDKIMAVLAIWMIFSRAKDKENLIKVYSKLNRLYPPKAELVISGEDRTEVAYKWDDSPLKETDNPSPMYSLDLSCLKLLAFDILERIAVKYGFSEAAQYGEAKRGLKNFINKELFNPLSGVYQNKYVSGEWSKEIGATSFYPLVAGAPEKEQLVPLINNLVSKKRFWSKYPVPTLIRLSKFYGKKSEPDQNGKVKPAFLRYRGSVVPYVNFIIYQGLIRYGLDEIAGDLAYKSTKLWQSHIKSVINNYAFYLPRVRRLFAGKTEKTPSGMGALLALMGIQTLIDIDYFRDDLKTALRFGTFAKGSHAVSKLKIMGAEYGISVDDYSTILLVNNQEVFKTEGGRCVVRQFIETDNGCEFIATTLNPVTLTLKLPFVHSPLKKRANITVTLPKGRSKVTVAGESVKVNAI